MHTSPHTSAREEKRPLRDTTNDAAVLAKVDPALLLALYEEAVRQVARWAREGMSQAAAEKTAYDNIEQTLAYLHFYGEPLWGYDAARHDDIKKSVLKMYRTCVRNDAVRDKQRAAARDGGSLNAPVSRDGNPVTGLDMLPEKRRQNGFPFDANDAYGGLFGRQVRALLAAWYKPEDARCLWDRLYYDRDWKEIASSRSEDALRKWGLRQITRLRAHLESDGDLPARDQNSGGPLSQSPLPAALKKEAPRKGNGKHHESH